jgi:hyaluronoglucosaminidase
MKGRRVQKVLAAVLAVAMVLPMTAIPAKAEEAEEVTYKLYPNPQEMTYQDGSYILKKNVNVIYDEDIDDATKARLKETAELKGLNVTESDAEKSGATNIYVGVYGSDGTVDDQIVDGYHVDTSLFDHTDSYFLKSDNNTIAVLGKDTDASFYGLTTLYHVLAQTESLSIRNFTIEDYADVVSRGFIEGYYGNPWSTEDRVNLMTWGGYYKLNAYFYAPKDDPKHRTKWNELYTDEELESKIRPLAEAGNASKCRFVYALHPFPSGNNFRFDTDAHYNEDLAKLKAKFKQVIDAGVRQIAILADDFVNPGAANEVRLLNDMSTWLAEVKQEYPDMKMTLPFVPYDYMGNGSSSELQALKSVPENVQIVMTGGRVWGEVTNNFTTTFTNNVGRGPFMWINWPCSDNSHKHLIMGGNSTFLHGGVDASKIQGIMLNPMQQSEPSKVAIFANASYAWNIWDTDADADQTWEDAFSFVDHNSAVETEASDALRELSKHMINQNMDSRVTELQESVELKEKLNAFKDKLETETVTEADVDDLIQEFQTLQDAAALYKESGNEAIRNQIVYWLDCWKDTTDAAIAYLNGVKSSLNGDVSAVVEYNTEGETAFAQSKTHDFLYVNYQEVAEVGVQHIVPFIKKLAEYVSGKAELALNPDKVIRKYITSRTDTPTGSADNLFDGDDSTSAIYKTPNKITTGTYIGVSYSKAIKINDIRFLLGAGKDHMDQAKLQYTTDGKTWKDLELIGMNNSFAGVRNQNQEVSVAKENLPEDFEAMGIRLIATADNAADAWLQVNEITINKDENTDDGDDSELSYTLMKPDRWRVHQGSESLLRDGNDSTFIWFNTGTGDAVNVDDSLGYDLGKVATLESVHIAVGSPSNGDKFVKYAVETSVDGTNWTPVPGYESHTGTTSGTDVLDIELNGLSAQYIRIRNLEYRHTWARFSEFTVTERVNNTGTKDNVFTNIENCDVLGTAAEGTVSLNEASLSVGARKYIGIDLGHIKAVTGITSPTGTSLKLQTSMNGVEWTEVTNPSQAADARYIRLYNDTGAAVDVSWDAFTVTYEFIGEKTVTSDFAQGDASRDMRGSGNVNHVFDGDLTTYGSITGAQDTGKKIVFDLGQTINFNSIRYYVKETSLDFLRYAKFEVANDPDAADEDWTPVLTVGNDSFENTWNDDKAKTYAALTHDSENPGNMYAEQTGLNVSGRYLRVVPLKTYSYRWVDFYEIQINGGAYISTESNRDIVSTVIEEKGKVPSNVFEEDYRTVYKPSEANGSFTYRISDLDAKRTIRMIQNGAASDAVVTARVANEDGSDIQAVTLGKLSQAINEFAVASDKRILDVTVTWGENIPEISMIKTSGKAAATVDKSKLDEAIAAAGSSDAANWTTDSKAAVEKAKAVAEELKTNEYATQDTVDTAAGALKTACNKAKVKADATVLEALRRAVEEKKSQKDGEVEVYTAKTFTAYENVLNKIVAALEDTDNLSQDTAEKLKTQIEEKEAALEYSKVERELAELELQAGADYNAADYTTASAKAYTDAKKALSDLIEADNTTRVNPTEIAAKNAAYTDSIAALVDVRSLKSLIAECNELHEGNEKQYTAASWKNYSDALDAANAVLAKGTTESVQAAETALRAAEEALVLKDTSAVQTVLDEMKKVNAENYTSDSYAVLKAAIAQAESQIDDETKADVNIRAMQDAKANLISIVELNAALSDAAKYEAANYTTDSYTVLAATVNADNMNALKTSGTAEQIAEAVQSIRNAIDGLVLRATDMDAYRDKIQFKSEAGDYTEETYTEYKEAYDALMALDSSTGNVSADEFQAAKARFENAQAALKMIKADYTKVDEALAKVPADLSIYTDATVKTLKDAIAKVDRNQPLSKQAEVDAYADAIHDAINNLVVKSKSDDGKDNQNGNSNNGQNNGNTAGNGNGSGKGNGTSSNGAVKTGDTAPIAGAFALMILAAGAVVTVLKRKRY